MKKSIIYTAIAILTISNTIASNSVLEHKVSKSPDTEVDSLKKVKPSETLVDSELINPETVFLRKESMPLSRVIAEDLAITDFCMATTASELAFPVMTSTEVASDNLIIEASIDDVAPLDFSIIDQLANPRKTGLNKCEFGAAL